ncbi:hypothetical protein FA95DRAFT_1567390 [Auriscalpium vulgare]|uniref:Uncharacterized protein n=1 Tax=Auriscalpium vulgare TaxID=40419 RepID=A0ACB8R4N0_9AGAM|nr:hypothetical protein FA95DRAFT_1567390 [Auriscalpium vulgare]
MSSSFSALIAYSNLKTEESERAVQAALAERKRKEALRIKQQEEADRKERQLQAKLREQHFQAEQREKDRLAALQRAQEARRLEAKRREDDHRESMLHGPKRSKSYPSSSSASTRDELRRRRFHEGLDDDDDDADSPGTALTREEKRQRRIANEYRLASGRRPTSGYSKSGRRLPGGALDMATPAPSHTPPDAAGSVRSRLAAIPNTLTKLNVVKRDTRTIDEIVRDREKARDGKVLDGDEAKEFHNWFGKSKEDKRVASAKKAESSRSASLSDSRSNTPSAPSKSSMLPSPKRQAISRTALAFGKGASSTSKARPPPPPASKLQSKPASRPAQHKLASSRAGSSKPPLKKRTRSLSLSDDESHGSMSPPPRKRKASQPSYSAEIWEMFGKNRDAYVQRDVFSDDEDMEADARSLEAEELKSARLARKEDQLAEEEERRREEEKRRRKKERDRRGY